MQIFPVLRATLQSLIAAPWFGSAVTVVLIAFFIFCVVKLHRFFFRRFCSFFSQHARLDDAIRKRLSRYARNWAVLFPLFLGGGMLWMKIVQNGGNVYGRHLGTETGLVILCFQLCFVVSAYRLVSFFEKCYTQNADSGKRPIRTAIFFLHASLVILMLLLAAAIVAKQRPIMLLSSVGAAVALFAFVFQNIISSFIANIQINAGNLIKIGDWIVIASRGVDGMVEMISSHTVKVRNWDMSTISFPVKLLLDETLVNYETMFRSGARQIRRSLRIDQRSIRFLAPEEVEQLKEQNLITDELLENGDGFDETGNLAHHHYWTNVELFTLYAEDYLRRRPDVRHDLRCLICSQEPSPQGLPLQVYCFSQKTKKVEFEVVQRSIFYHLLAILPSFRLRVYQECSDVYQEIGDVPDRVGGAFRFDQLKNPVYPSDR